MTKQEVMAALTQKMQANRDEVQRQLEFVATLPGHTVHQFDEKTGRDVDLLHQLSVTWKEGQALRELALELVGIVYDKPAQVPPEARPS